MAEWGFLGAFAALFEGGHALVESAALVNQVARTVE